MTCKKIIDNCSAFGWYRSVDVIKRISATIDETKFCFITKIQDGLPVPFDRLINDSSRSNIIKLFDKVQPVSNPTIQIPCYVNCIIITGKMNKIFQVREKHRMS